MQRIAPFLVALACLCAVVLHTTVAVAASNAAADVPTDNLTALARQLTASQKPAATPAATSPAAKPAAPASNESLPLGPVTPNQPGSTAGARHAASTTANTSGSGGWFMQTIAALAVVVVLILLLRSLMSRLSGRPTAAASHPLMEVLTRMSIAPRNHVLLLRLDQRILVVGDSPAGLRTLSVIDQPDEVAHILAVVSASRPHSVTRSFRSFMDRFNGDHRRQMRETEGLDHAEFATDRTRDELSSLRWRLRSLGGSPDRRQGGRR